MSEESTSFCLKDCYPSNTNCTDAKTKMPNQNLLRSALLTFIMLSFSSVGQAATYFVAANGNDSNPGTQASPFRTIQKAADIVNAGDTVMVGDGSYTDTNGDGIVVYVRRGGTSSNWVIFKSINKWGAKIEGQAAKHGWHLAANYIRVEGFDVTGMAVDGADAFASSTGNSNQQIVGNHIHDIGHVCSNSDYGFDGIFMTSSNMLIEGNVFHDIGRLGPGENGCNPGNTNYTNHDHAIYLNDVSNVIIRNNVFYSNKSGWSIHLYPTAASGVKILNNTFADANPYRVGQITVNMNLTNVDISNNVFFNPTTAGIRWDAGTHSGVTVRNNLSTNLVNDVARSGVVSSGNITNANPLFMDSNNRNYRLQVGSPAKDAGLNLGADVAFDFDGTSRPQGGAYDIGAFEYVSGGSTIHAPSNLAVLP